MPKRRHISFFRASSNQVTFAILFFLFRSVDYNEGTAMAHVRRLLDFVACTTCFGPSPEKSDSVKNAQAKGGGKNPKQTETSPPPSPAPKDAVVDEAGETSHSFPKLGSFYEFFSLAHITPPLQCKILSPSLTLNSMSIFSIDLYMFIDVRLVAKRETEDIAADDHLLSIDVSAKIILLSISIGWFLHVAVGVLVITFAFW